MNTHNARHTISVDSFSHNTGFETSARYVPINTAELVSQFEAAGFGLHGTSAARVKNIARQGFQKHLFSFRHDNLQLKNVGDSVPQIILKNSYDGSSSLQVMLGIYRFVCANGLIVGSSWASYRIRHVGANAVQSAVQAALDVSKQADLVADKVQLMQAKLMSQGEMFDLAAAAAQLVRPDNALMVDVSSLLTPRRAADTDNNLWTVYNRIQENVIRGGLVYSTANSNGTIVRRTRRAVRAIDANIKLNKGLWILAENALG